MVAKQLVSGKFDKMKSRLVADGRDQEVELYPDKSSLMFAIHSMFTVLGMMAAKPWRVTVKIDIKGALIPKPMKGEPTYMRLDKSLTEQIINMLPRPEGAGRIRWLPLRTDVERDVWLYSSKCAVVLSDQEVPRGSGIPSQCDGQEEKWR